MATKAVGQARKAGKADVFIFAILTRLRQFCAHSALVPQKFIDDAKIAQNPDDSTAVMGDAEDEDIAEDDCFLCGTVVTNQLPLVTPCKHVFCKKCLITYAAGQFDIENERDVEENEQMKHRNFDCPYCSSIISWVQCREVRNKDDKDGEKASKNQSFLHKSQITAMARAGNIDSCPKIDALIHELLENPFDKSPDAINKTIVFSQWTTMLDIVQSHLEAYEIGFVRLDGQTQRAHRDDAMFTFNNDDSCIVFLISLGAGGQGINLTSANRVILIDPWWNPAAEDQAIDRVHRLGQTQPVEVVRMVMKGSIEMNVKALQDKKRKLIRTTLGGFMSKEQRGAVIQDIAALFGKG